MITPAADGFRMPAEWAPHERTWMALAGPQPDLRQTPTTSPRRARLGARSPARSRRFEPVTVVCGPGAVATRPRGTARPGRRRRRAPTRRRLDARHRPDLPHRRPGRTRRRGLDVQRLGRPGLGPLGARREDRRVRRRTSRAARRTPRSWSTRAAASTSTARARSCSPRPSSSAPSATRAGPREQVEAELHAHLGTAQGDLAAARPHRRLRRTASAPAATSTSSPPSPAPAWSSPTSSPTRPTPTTRSTREPSALLRAATDARGRRLEVVELPAPTVLEADGELVDYSYINHYLCNGGVVLCAFDDPRDEVAAEHLPPALPGADGDTGRRPYDLRRRRRHPLHHPAAAEGLTRGQSTEWPGDGQAQRRQERAAARGRARRRHGHDRRARSGEAHHGGARPRGRHEQRPSPLLLPLQGRAAAADPGVERGPARRRARPAAGPRRGPPASGSTRTSTCTSPTATGTRTGRCGWRSGTARRTPTTPPATARPPSRAPGTATWWRCSPRASRAASSGRSTRTASPPGCGPCSTASPSMWRSACAARTGRSPGPRTGVPGREPRRGLLNPRPDPCAAHQQPTDSHRHPGRPRLPVRRGRLDRRPPPAAGPSPARLPTRRREAAQSGTR